ncbi:MAG: TldD/PmbA family protein [Coriobacteriia bacterium]|jgi:predicted Zn-dependent protease|nr:TldD/PmbA family protein [Coriobacteriia bacterium]
MSRLSSKHARELAARAVALTKADGAEAIVTSGEESLTRFADNRIHQNVTETDTRVSVRAVIGRQQGVASTNRLDDDSLAACCAAAAQAASAAPADPDFPGLPAPAPIKTPERATETARHYGPKQRADAVYSMVRQCSSRLIKAAGGVASSVSTVAVANSLGVDAGMETTAVRATVLAQTERNGSGWASFFGPDPADLDADALGERAATLATRSEHPINLDPGTYAVVLAPEAVADIVDFLGYLGFSARAFEEGRSFMNGQIGERIMSEQVTIFDDALAPEACGLTFDFEGMPKRRVVLIDHGIATGVVTDSYWAARSGRENTGHALPAPNPYGPMALDLQMAPGSATIDQLISSVERGVYVTRFHYVNVEDPVPATLTGMTRDGTFLIQDGALTSPLKNLRFTQSAVAAMNAVSAVTSQRARFEVMVGSVLAPGVLIDGWEFTGQTG